MKTRRVTRFGIANQLPWVVTLFVASVSSTSLAEPPSESPDPAAKKYDLRYQFQPDETVRWEVVHRAAVTTTIKGSSQTANTWTESIKAWKVTRAQPDGPFAIEHSVESVKMTNQLPNRAKVQFDSQVDSEPPPGFEQAAKAVGVPLTAIRIDAHGKVLQRKDMQAQPTADGLTPIALELPAEPVAVGHVWDYPQDVSLTAADGTKHKIKTRQRLKLQSVKAGVASIATDYQVLTPIRDPGLEAQLIQRLSKGTVKFDIDAGRMIGQQLDVDRRVVGFSGAASSMHYRMRLTEKLLASPAKVAREAKSESARESRESLE